MPAMCLPYLPPQVSSFGDHPLLQPAAAQLANAMVAVLGPQFTLGSLAYSRCKTLVTDNTGDHTAAFQV